MQNTQEGTPHDGTSVYDLFIGALTVLSLLVVVWMLMPWLSEATRTALLFMDTLICIVFLVDFGVCFARAPRKLRYLTLEGGVLDLIGAIPVLPGLRVTGLVRFARLARFSRIAQALRDEGSPRIIGTLRRRRAEGALASIVILAIVALTLVSVLVLQAESRSDNPNIVTGGDAFWWSFVTITTVGYGDFYPTTTEGRALGMVLMTIGVGIFGVLTSYFASTFVTPARREAAQQYAPPETGTIAPSAEQMHQLREELAAVRSEMAQIRALLQASQPPPAGS
jgi:voltage-gated potassium channel